MVSPIPSASKAPMPIALLMVPELTVPDSVTPRCNGKSVRLGQQFISLNHEIHIGMLNRDDEILKSVS